MQLQYYLGKCSCGKATLQLRLPQQLSRYTPRACDCDFCVREDITYLSDPQGSLSITCNSDPKVVKQGSNQASFLLCSSCDDVLCVTYSVKNVLKGALNVKKLDNFSLLLKAQEASRKLLSPERKVGRWRNLWMKTSIKLAD